MKLTLPTFARTLFLALLGLLALGRVALAGEATAFELLKEAKRHVGEDVKERVSQLRSEKSIGSLTPNIWYVVFFDDDAAAKATEVKFLAGTKVKVQRPARVLEFVSKSQLSLPKEKLKIDSDKALEIARTQPLLKNLTLKASRLTLERQSRDVELPVWKIRLWAAKLNNPNAMANLGEVFISAEDGKVVKNDLHIERVD